MRGVDVSYFNDKVDWRAVRAAGYQFAICRTGWGKLGYDETFARNVQGAHHEGLICGAYHYSYALEPDDAIDEAKNCAAIIEESGLLLELPVFFDMEDADGWKKQHGFNFTRDNITAICAAFLDEIQPLNAGVYASYSWLEALIDWQRLKCPIWNAQWSNYDFLKGYMWQYTDQAKIGGKYFDANWLYEG